MDNILRKTIRDEIAAALSGQPSVAGLSSITGQSSVAGQSSVTGQSSSKGMKREQRLGSLLSKIHEVSRIFLTVLLGGGVLCSSSRNFVLYFILF